MKHLAIFILLTSSCGGSEAVETQLPVVVDSSRVQTVETNLGYSVAVRSARGAIRDLEFTIEGEEHVASTMDRVWSYLVPSAYAHPGHAADGEVTGELRGNFIIDWSDDGQALGPASLLTGQYRGVNFGFRRAEAADGLSEADPLLGHTLHLELDVSRGEDSYEVDLTLDLDDDARLVGTPFDHRVTASSGESIGLQLATEDPYEGGTLFDDVDFAAIEVDADGITRIAPGQATHNQLRRLFGSHDFYFVVAR